MSIIHPKILLASKSPRRKQLLAELGFKFEIVHQDIEESFPQDISIREIPSFLANKKAKAVFSKLKKNQIILASDTIVLQNNTIHHKPKDHSDAKRILRNLSDSTHEVITGVCLMNTKKTVSFSCISKVFFASITEQEIDFYINKYQPFDKAGAYAIQEWIGMAKIKKIEGSYHNIVGLPTHEVYQAIIKFNQ